MNEALPMADRTPNSPNTPRQAKTILQRIILAAVWLWMAIFFMAYLRVLSPYAKPVMNLLADLLPGLFG